MFSLDFFLFHLYLSSPYSAYLSSYICAQMIKQGSRQPSLDMHSCPQSAEYDCSPRAKEQTTRLNIFSLFKCFPRVPEMGQKNDHLGQRMPPCRPAFPRSLLCFFQSCSFQSHPSACVKLFFPKAHH